MEKGMRTYGYHSVKFDGAPEAVQRAREELAGRLLAACEFDDPPDPSGHGASIHYCGRGYFEINAETVRILEDDGFPKDGLTEIRYHSDDGDVYNSEARLWRTGEGWRGLVTDHIHTQGFSEAEAIDRLILTGEGLKEMVEGVCSHEPENRPDFAGAFGRACLVSEHLDLDRLESEGISMKTVKGFSKWIRDTVSAAEGAWDVLELEAVRVGWLLEYAGGLDGMIEAAALESSCLAPSCGSRSRRV